MENYEKEHYWEFFLRDNPLTKDNTEDCIAEVKTGPKTLTKEDTAREIKRTGSELKLPTILSVTTQDSDMILEALLDGYSVITDLCQFTPRILGNFDSSKAAFDPAIHKLTFDIVPTKKLRDALKNVKTINLGKKKDVAEINLVTDTITLKTNGSITPGKYIRIEGERIKVVGEDSVVGVFFVSADGSKTFPAETPYIQNEPKCIEHEGEGQLIVTVENPGNQALALRVFGEGLEKPLENRFEATDNAEIAGALESWLPVGEYDVLVTADVPEEIELKGIGSFATATAAIRIPEGATTLPALNQPVYAATKTGITLAEGKTATLTFKPKDIRKILRFTVTAPAGLISDSIEATLGGIAPEINLATGKVTSSAMLGLTLPTPDAGNTSRKIAGVLGVGDSPHLLTLSWQTTDGKKQVYSEDVSESLKQAIEAGADTIDVAVSANANVPIQLYTAIRTRTLVDKFNNTPVNIAAGTVTGHYTESWAGIATDSEIILDPIRYYPSDGSPLYLRGYYPPAPLTNGKVNYKLTGKEDLMLSVEQNGSLADRFESAESALTYRHLLSQLTFKLQLNGTKPGYRIRSLQLNGLAASATISLGDETLVPEGNAGAVNIYDDGGAGGIDIKDGVVTLPGYVLVQPKAELTIDFVIAIDNNPAHDKVFTKIPIRFTGSSEGGSAYIIEVTVDVSDPDEPTDPDTPVDPTPPVDPDDPTDPDIPVDPVPPVDPDKPTPPVDPDDPDDGDKIEISIKVIASSWITEEQGPDLDLKPR